MSLGDQIDMADAKRLGHLCQHLDGRVALATLQAADILLADTGAFGHLLLSKPTLFAQARKIPAEQLADVHERTDRRICVVSLSTIVCKCADGRVRWMGDFCEDMAL